MKTYRVVTRQYTYLVANVTANSEQEAGKIALESDALDWDWCDYGNSEIELVEAIDNEPTSQTVTDKLKEFFESQDPSKLMEALRCS